MSDVNIDFSVGGSGDFVKKLMADIECKLPEYVRYDEYHKLPGSEIPTGLSKIREHFLTKEPCDGSLPDAHGSTYHWSRSLNLPRNHWSTRAVANETFD